MFGRKLRRRRRHGGGSHETAAAPLPKTEVLPQRRRLLPAWLKLPSLPILAGGVALIGASAAGGAWGALYLANSELPQRIGVMRDKALVYVQREVLKQEVSAESQKWTPLTTGLHDLEYAKIPLTVRPDVAGAFTQLPGDRFLVAKVHGDFVDYKLGGAPKDLAIPTPLNLKEFQAHEYWSLPSFRKDWFRINDVLALPAADEPGAYDLFATHHYFNPDRACITFRMSRMRLMVDADTIAPAGDWTLMFESKPCVELATDKAEAFGGHLSGGRMIEFDKDRLLVTTGEQTLFESRRVNVSDNPDSALGKMLLVDKASGAWTVYLKGTRNAQGLVRAHDGRIWATEHGPRGGDEFNLVKEGADLGFPHVTLGINYDQLPWPGAVRQGDHAGFQQPKYAWMPSVGISQLIQMQGKEFPNWENDIIAASMGGRSLFRLRTDGDDVVYAERMQLPGFGIRDIERLSDGRFAALTTRMDLLLFRNANGPGENKALTLAQSIRMPPNAHKNKPSKERLAVIQTGAETFAAVCTHCHNLSGMHASAPHLNELEGRPIGKVEGYQFTPALAGRGGRWTEAKVTEYLLDPEKFAPGTAMVNMGLTKPQAEALAAFLKEPWWAPSTPPKAPEAAVAVEPADPTPEIKPAAAKPSEAKLAEAKPSPPPQSASPEPTAPEQSQSAPGPEAPAPADPTPAAALDAVPAEPPAAGG